MVISKSGKRLYNYAEVTAMVGVCEPTIRRYARDLGMTLYTENGVIHFDESQIIKFVEKKDNPGKKGKTKKKSSSKSE